MDLLHRIRLFEKQCLMLVGITVGRQKELQAIHRNITQGHHTMLFGKSGVGKTHLLIQAQTALQETDASVFFRPKPNPMSETAAEVYLWLCKTAAIIPPMKKGDKTRISDYVTAIAKVLAHEFMAGKRLVFIFDEFDSVRVDAISLYEILAERGTLIVAGRKRAKGPAFSRLLHRFDEIEIKPLSVALSKELVVYSLERVQGLAAMKASTRDFLINQTAVMSSGIPLAIVESVERLRGAERIDRNFVRELFVHRSGNLYFDATPLWLGVFVFLVFMRYISRGMYQFDMYAVFGALSGVMLLARWWMSKTSQDREA